MSDIFLNYAVEDQRKAVKLATIFRGRSWTVWDALRTPPREKSSDVLIKELEDTKVVVVLWSRAARASQFVDSMLRHVGQVPVVNVLIENVRLPPEWSPRATFDLSEWDGWLTPHLAIYRATALSFLGLKYSEASRFLDYVANLLAKSPPAAPPPAVASAAGQSEVVDPPRPPEKTVEPQQAGGQGAGGVFISYRRGEASAYAGRLYDRLAARFGKQNVFIDTENVGWGEDFVEAITEAAESCAVMIALISPRWSRGGQEEEDDYVRLEVAKALGRKIRVIPILIQGASMPAPKELPEDLAPLVRRNALALSDTRWERDVEDLIETLEGLLKG